jgi:hypothetical protein
MNYIHGNDIVESWQKMTLDEQMGNIGSEVSRASKWQIRDHKIFMSTVWRAIELMDLTISDRRNLSCVKEILRAKEVFCDILFGEKQYNTTLEDLDKYFTQFALAARGQRDDLAKF